MLQLAPFTSKFTRFQNKGYLMLWKVHYQDFLLLFLIMVLVIHSFFLAQQYMRRMTLTSETKVENTSLCQLCYTYIGSDISNLVSFVTIDLILFHILIYLLWNTFF